MAYFLLKRGPFRLRLPVRQDWVGSGVRQRSHQHAVSRFGLSVALLLGGAAPADASILPRVDFVRGDADLAVGLFDLAVDYALHERLTVGAAWIPSIFPVPFTAEPTLLAGRLTWRGGEVGSLVWGGTASVMSFRNPTSGKSNFFVQPALNLAWRPGQGAFTLRATLGLMSYDLPAPVPNVEFAFRVFGNHELTFLGGGLVGWRGRF